MTISPADIEPAADLRTERLVLEPITSSVIAALMGETRMDHWAADFPAAGDIDTAQLLTMSGTVLDAATDFGVRLIRVSATNQVVGTCGFHGPPMAGEVEIAYSVVPSAQEQGFATELVAALADFALNHPEVDVVRASTTPENVASAAVLEANGFIQIQANGPGLVYQLRR